MTNYLILVKHSVPEIYGDRPANTWNLSEEGRLRAQHLAEELKSFAPDEIVASELGLAVQMLPGLHEHDRSNVPYLSHDAFQASMRDFFQEPDQLVFGRETANQVHTRFYQAVHHILNEFRG